MKRKDVNLKLMPEAFAKFTAWCRRHGYTKQTKLALMVDDLVVGEKLEPMQRELQPAQAQVHKPEPVIKPAYQMTPEQKKAYDEERAKLRAEFNPEEVYLRWRHRGCTQERATQIVDDACRNWEMTWGGVTPELEGRVRPRKTDVVETEQTREDGDDPA